MKRGEGIQAAQMALVIAFAIKDREEKKVSCSFTAQEQNIEKHLREWGIDIRFAKPIMLMVAMAPTMCPMAEWALKTIAAEMELLHEGKEKTMGLACADAYANMDPNPWNDLLETYNEKIKEYTELQQVIKEFLRTE